MEVKIKQGTEMLDATIEIIDGVMVVSPKVETFEPKNGDVVTVTTETGGNYTCFFKGCVNGDVYSYGGLNNLYNMLFKIGLVCCIKELKTIYPATEEEKKKLFDKLAEKGYEFDFEKKELVKLRWKPKLHERYFAPWINMGERVYFFHDNLEWENDSIDKELYEKGWVFQTKEECEAFCKKLNDVINQVKP